MLSSRQFRKGILLLWLWALILGLRGAGQILNIFGGFGGQNEQAEAVPEALDVGVDKFSINPTYYNSPVHGK